VFWCAGYRSCWGLSKGSRSGHIRTALAQRYKAFATDQPSNRFVKRPHHVVWPFLPTRCGASGFHTRANSRSRSSKLPVVRICTAKLHPFTHGATNIRELVLVFLAISTEWPLASWFFISLGFTKRCDWPSDAHGMRDVCKL
jgi:hypothetical protein